MAVSATSTTAWYYRVHNFRNSCMQREIETLICTLRASNANQFQVHASAPGRMAGELCMGTGAFANVGHSSIIAVITLMRHARHSVTRTTIQLAIHHGGGGNDERQREREGLLHTIAAKLDCNVRRIGIAKRHNCPGSTPRAHFPIDDCSTTDSFHLFIPVYRCCLSATTTRSQLKLKLFYSIIYPFNVPSGATFIGGTHAHTHTHRARCTLHNATQRTMHFLYNFSCRAFYLRSH